MFLAVSSRTDLYDDDVDGVDDVVVVVVIDGVRRS
jgi:hypothetical protein